MQGWFQNLFAVTLGLGDLGVTVDLMVSVIIKIMIVLIPLVLTAAYLTYFERKVIGFIQLRVGPNVTDPWGLVQSFADVFKLLFKEVTRPKLSNKALFYIGPIMSLAPSFAAWAVVPFNKEWMLANISTGLSCIPMITSLSVYGVIIAGWASNSKYSFLGTIHTSVQSISYEIIMSAALVYVVMVSGNTNFSDIVTAQAKGTTGGSVLSWNWLPLFPIFVVYLISAVAETSRAPFNVAEGESEIVVGYHVEYSGFTFALFFLAEYIFVILITALTSLMFPGDWLSPFPQNWGIADTPSTFQMSVKTTVMLYWYLQVRVTFPHYRYDRIMRLGQKVLAPIGFTYIMILGLQMISPLNLWK